MTAFMEVQGAFIRYPVQGGSIQALSDIRLDIEEGEFIALIGENGSGKSTLAKLLNALLIPDEGNVLVDGMNTRDRMHHPVIRSQVSMVFQRSQDQIVATTVEEDVAFGPGNLGLPREEIRRRVDASLNVTGLEAFRERVPYLLSAGETQHLALAGVLAMQPKCVIFDETTAMLDPAGREMVMAQAKALHTAGKTILFITHLMEEAVQAERVIALHLGKVSLDGTPREVFSSPQKLRAIGLDTTPSAYIANLLKKHFPHLPSYIYKEEDLLQTLPVFNGKGPSLSLRKNKGNGKSAIIEVKNLAHTYLAGTPLVQQALVDGSLKVKAGAAHGLIGPTGSGKSTLLQHLNGLLRPQSGSVNVGGFDLNNSDIDLKQLRRKVALAFQQPEDQIFEQYVGDEVAYAPRNLGCQGTLSDVVEAAMEAVGLDFHHFKDRLTSTLSGGERRKVALASALSAQPEILLLDEPLAGLDPRSREALGKHLAALRNQGLTLIISTHQYEGLVEWMSQVSILAQGRDRLHGSPGDVFAQSETLSAVGLKPPLTSRIARTLRERGWPIDSQIISMKDLDKSLAVIKKEDQP